MTYADIHTLAARGEALPPFSSLPDRLCYEELCMLKEKYERGELDEKGLRRLKQVVRRSYEEYDGAFRQYMAVYREYCDNSLKTGQDVRAMLEGLKAENPDWRGLFLLAVACIGRMQHDEAAVRLIREKADGPGETTVTIEAANKPQEIEVTEQT